MDEMAIVAAIDEEIGRLQHVRAILAGANGRPPARSNASPQLVPPAGKRKLSLAARRRIAEAQRKRWAASKAAKNPMDSAPKAAKKPLSTRVLLQPGRRRRNHEERLQLGRQQPRRILLQRRLLPRNRSLSRCDGTVATKLKAWLNSNGRLAEFRSKSTAVAHCCSKNYI